MYEEIEGMVRRLSDGAWIPVDEDNADYREYLDFKASI